MPTYWFDATDSNAHPEDASDLYDDPGANALADADKVRPVTLGDIPALLGDDFESDAAAVEAGVCPWCDGEDRYEGDHVGRHASSAHEEKWREYKSE